MRSICIAAAFLFAVSLAIGGTAGAADTAAKAEKSAEKAEKSADKAEKSAEKAEKSATKAEKSAKKMAGAPVTLTGDMTCGKCGLSETDKCQNVLKVAEGGAETKYYLVHNDVAKKNHSKVCQGSAKATVKGTVAEDGGKKTLAATEITYQ